MAAKSLNYLDIPVEQRREAAAKARANLRALLANPAQTLEQRALLQKRIVHLSKWEAGLLEVTPSEAEPEPEPKALEPAKEPKKLPAKRTRKPVNHEVKVDEGLSISEDEI